MSEESEEDAVFGRPGIEPDMLGGIPPALGGFMSPIWSRLMSPIWSRLQDLRDSRALLPLSGDYIYGLARTNLLAVTRRVVTSSRFARLVDEGRFSEADLVRYLTSGQADGLLVETYHERASAEHYYAKEKRWD